MQLHPDGTLVVSATDLVGFLECDHLTTLELGRAQGLWQPPHHREDPTLDLLRRKGGEHERRYLERQRAAGQTIVEIARPDRTLDSILAAADETTAALRRGVDVVFQATLFDGRWLGYADFLVRVDTPSTLGAWSYEVADTKLSQAVKGGAVLQVCVYADLLERLQGYAPAQVHIVTGDGVSHAFRLNDFAAYHRSVKRRFELEVFGDTTSAPRDPTLVTTYPDQVEHCRVCSWYPDCAEQRRADDHLSIVAGLARTATEHLHAAGIWRRRELAGLPAGTPVEDLSDRTLERLRAQAAIQVRGEDEGELLYELIPPDPDQLGQGLARLPEPSALDVSFDIEADPWAAEDGTGFGLEYLLGVAERSGDRIDYQAIWGTDRQAERTAFESFIDQVTDRRRRDPGMHVYHYGGYEPGALKRLMQRHATRSDELDQLLRDEVFVDLLAVVRQGLRASVESYSLKRIEKFYMPLRSGPVTDAGFSVVEFEAWLTDGDQAHLDGLAEYNRDDCVSTLELRDWLEQRRQDAILVHGWSIPRPEPADLPSEDLQEQIEVTRRREAALRDGLSPDADQRDALGQARWLLSRLIDWHRREDRPQWWNWFRLRELSVDDLIGEREALAGLVYDRQVVQEKQSTTHRYRFPVQETKLRPGDTPFDPDDGDRGAGAGTIVEIDLVAGTVDLKRLTRREHHPVRLIQAAPIGGGVMRDALGDLADWVVAHGVDADGPWRAGRDLLLRRPPRLRSSDVGSLVCPGERTVDAARRLALELDRGILGIQGPPGTGKTWTGARMVVELVRAGRRVGITAQAHKAITNMLVAIDEAAREAGVPWRALQRCEPEDGGADLPSVRIVGNSNQVPGPLSVGEIDVAAGTSWVFARADMAEAVDVLFVDEAGQMSLANVLAMSRSARSIVLLGDPNQLAQVTQGVHLDGADASALEHLIGDHVTMPAELGLLLETTFRMHPAVNDYISPTFYDGQVVSAPMTLRQAVGPGSPGGVGVRWEPVIHRGRDSSSTEEAEIVVDAVEALLGRAWVDQAGRTRQLSGDDILVVAPYNLQVGAIEAAARARGIPVRVGTVDKFQGQEGAVAIYSMTSSTAEDAPRGMDFLYERNRLNVAVSRARALAIVVASPELVRVACRTPEQMRKANALCAYLESAGD